jgi:1,4-alpha-glucan branching enzyme
MKWMRRISLNIISLILFSLSIVSCAPRHFGPEMTRDGVFFSFYAPAAKSVTIAGSFNAWDIRKDSLAGPDNNGVWTIVLSLSPGRYEYLFIVDGKDWQPDPSVPAVDDGFGGKNSVLLVPEEHSGL